MATNGEPLLVISWNVAGWTTTQLCIRNHYGTVQNYLQRMGRPAIFCIQEAKVQSQKLRNEAVAKDLGAIVKGYRSFWAFNESKDPRRGHLQGVATWVREDLPTLGATQRVFEDSELNAEGRVLLTDHGAFVVLNVYAPYAGAAAASAPDGSSSGDLRRKLRFLQELGRVMEEVQVQGKRVLLCGDLNLTHRQGDQKPWRRLLRIDETGYLHASLPSSLKEKQETPEQSGERLLSKAATDRKLIPMTLGPLLEQAGQWKPVKEIAEALSLPSELLAVAGECLHIAEGDCVPWLRQRVTPLGQAPFADIFAEMLPEAVDRFTTWGQSSNGRYKNLGTRIDYIICDRETFAHCMAESPLNKLAGACPLLPSVGGNTNCESEEKEKEEKGKEEEKEKEKEVGSNAVPATSAAAALNAATHYGGWHAAACIGLAQGDGLSLQADNMRLNDSQFPAEPHTGMIYTPPSYSDHIPVSALFTMKLLLRPPRSDAASPSSLAEQPLRRSLVGQTRETQPWLGQPSIGAFFKCTPSKSSAASVAKPEAPGAPPSKKLKI